MSQSNKVCVICHTLGHSKFYCPTKPRKPLQRVAIKKTVSKSTKHKPVNRSKLVKDLDAAFSIYIRMTKSVNGLGTCVTCGTIKPWREMQNGHFYTRGRYPTRWDIDNCHIQDAACNVFLKGNYINYTKYMIDTYGREFIDELELKSRQIVKYKNFQLQEMLNFYRGEVKKLQQNT